MTVKNVIFEILRNKIGEYASAKKLQENLGLSRKKKSKIFTRNII